MIKTAVIGASGFVGRHLLRAYRRHFPDCVGTSFSNPDPALTPFDIRTPDLAALRLEETGHRAVVITSAKPNVEYCERERDAAHAVNVAGMLELIRQIGRTSLSVVFLSTDYVFEGTTGNYADDAPTRPTTEYGRQKAFVEKEIPSLSGSYLVVRLSKIFGLQKGDGTLLDDIAGNLAAGKEVKAAADQRFCPTEVTDLVAAIQRIQQSESNRVVNACAGEAWSRYEIAAALAGAMGLDAARVQRISLHDIPSMKDRPLNTSMVGSRLSDGSSLTFAPLRPAIARVAANWVGAAGVAA